MSLQERRFSPGYDLKPIESTKYISIFPEYPMSVFGLEEIKRYRRKVLHARIEGEGLIRILNGPSKIIKTVDGHHVNKDFVVGIRDYVCPHSTKSERARYERRSQVNLYVSMELVTLEKVSGVIAVRKITDNVEMCLERTMIPAQSHDFLGVLTDWNTTEKLDTLIDPGIAEVFDQAKLSHSFLAVNKSLIKSFVLVRNIGSEPVESLLAPPADIMEHR